MRDAERRRVGKAKTFEITAERELKAAGLPGRKPFPPRRDTFHSRTKETNRE
jgi:hypothetical protein